MEASGLLKIYNFILKELEAKRYYVMQSVSHCCILFICKILQRVFQQFLFELPIQTLESVHGKLGSIIYMLHVHLYCVDINFGKGNGTQEQVVKSSIKFACGGNVFPPPPPKKTHQPDKHIFSSQIAGYRDHWLAWSVNSH